MRVRCAEKEAYWRKVVHRQEESGQSVRRFCREEGISEASFYGWRRELQRRDRQEKRSPAVGGGGACPSPFVALRVVPETTSVIEIVHPRGYIVRAPAQVDCDALRQVLAALDGAREG
ncbi:IS66 family insertion sequence element accessory protein TnpA [Planctomycetes bacterium Pan216]|uniref:IS66 family insertion sequence element accessory protein TnpA n=1 Tax=Kolteria novifilia TaxID=2527975 RepID=UPI0011A2A017